MTCVPDVNSPIDLIMDTIRRRIEDNVYNGIPMVDRGFSDEREFMRDWSDDISWDSDEDVKFDGWSEAKRWIEMERWEDEWDGDDDWDHIFVEAKLRDSREDEDGDEHMIPLHVNVRRSRGDTLETILYDIRLTLNETLKDMCLPPVDFEDDFGSGSGWGSGDSGSGHWGSGDWGSGNWGSGDSGSGDGGWEDDHGQYCEDHQVSFEYFTCTHFSRYMSFNYLMMGKHTLVWLMYS